MPESILDVFSLLDRIVDNEDDNKSAAEFADGRLDGSGESAADTCSCRLSKTRPMMEVSGKDIDNDKVIFEVLFKPYSRTAQSPENGFRYINNS